MEKIVIIGNGISGVTAARHIRKNSDKQIVIISAESEHFYSRTALMYIYMGHMRYEDVKPYEDWFWDKNRIELKFDYVAGVNTATKTLSMKSGDTVNYDKLVLAVGSKPNKFGWEGQDLDGVQGMYSLQDLEKIEKYSKNAKRAVIVGGGLIGVELTEMMLSRDIATTILVREGRFWGNVLPKGEGELVQRHMVDEHHVDLRLNTELEAILDDGNGRVKGVRTKSGDVIDCELVGLTAGVSPNIGFLEGSAIETKRGILVNEFFETNIADVYAIGDCAEFKTSVNGRRNIEQVWYTGRIMGETLAYTLTGNKKAYDPGPWFNSAKFFDIEYQTYGWVFPDLKEGETDFYWEHEKGKKCIHLVWDKASHEFKGINVFGIRLRHELFDKWLKEKRSVKYVMENLNAANFDPEFYKKHEKEIVGKFNTETELNVSLNKKKWWRKLLTQNA